MKLSVFLPSHNKGGFAVEAVRSVLEQDYDDYELWIMENSTDDGRTRNLLRKFTDLTDPRVRYEEIDVALEVRQSFAVCPWLNNRYYKKATGEVILYLSDDDLFMPGLFTAVAAHFEENPEHEALYFHLARTTAQKPGDGRSWAARFMGISADRPRGQGQVDCIIDGGQIAYRTSVLTKFHDNDMLYFFEGKETVYANHADGTHMENLAQFGVVFHPLNVPGVIHRHTPASTWSKV